MNLQKHIFNKNKGILAIDESENTSRARFAGKNLVSTEPLRQMWRSSIIGTDKIENYLSGLIVVEETINQMDQFGVSLMEKLRQKNIKIFIKADEGLDKNPVQPLTIGLENLEEKLTKWNKKYGQNVVGTKWRVVILTSKNEEKLNANSKKSLEQLAKYAKIVLSFGLTPIVEPEILVDKNLSEEKTVNLHKNVIQKLVENLEKEALDLQKIILKVGFTYTLEQKENFNEETICQKISQQTLQVLNESGAEKFMGVVFLSGGLNPDQSSKILRKVLQNNQEKLLLTFSFGRAIQDEAFDEWVKTQDYDNKTVQQTLINRLEKISLN